MSKGNRIFLQNERKEKTRKEKKREKKRKEENEEEKYVVFRPPPFPEVFHLCQAKDRHGNQADPRNHAFDFRSFPWKNKEQFRGGR